MRFFKLCASIASIVFLSGCATIMKDDSQPVAFSTEPDDATVKFNSVARGKTPVTLMVKRSMKETIVTIEKKGYRTETFPLEKSMSAMTFGNIIFGGIIGVGVDAATGKNTNYPDNVHINLVETFSTNDARTNEPVSVSSQRNSETSVKRKLMLDYQNGVITADEYIKLLQDI